MIAIPTLILFLTTAVVALIRRGSRWLPLALLCSAAGDYAGSVGQFYPQMGLFAAALGCYIRSFVPYVRLTAGRLRPLVVVLIVLVVGFGYVASHIHALAELAAVSLYATLLLSLLAAALVQHRPLWGWYVVAAALFVLSDALLGYTRFVAPLPAADWWILSPYYAAQTLFAVLYLFDRAKSK